MQEAVSPADAAVSPVDAAAPPTSTRRWLIVISVSSAMGLVFGLTFAKSRVFEPGLIRGQFLFAHWVMLKMFMGAMGSGALVLAICARVHPEMFRSARLPWISGLQDKGLVTGVGLGATLLGVGMATAGACPGMVLAQVGSGVENSGITLAGGFVGALVYGLAEGPLTRRLVNRGPKLTKVGSVDELLGSVPLLCSALGVFCIAVAGLLEALVPWVEDLPPASRNLAGCNPFTSCRAWPPSVAGLVLGLLQAPALVVINTFLGSATSYQVACSVCAAPLLGARQPEGPAEVAPPAAALEKHPHPKQPKFPYLASFARPRVRTWWQLFYVSFAMLAAFIMTTLVDDLGLVGGVDAASAFCGGFLMLFGSRMAGGCTSGHGISGCALLIVHSWFAVPCMFGGGIITALVWNAASGGNFLV